MRIKRKLLPQEKVVIGAIVKANILNKRKQY